MSNYSYFCGIDLAKNYFSLHVVDQNGRVLLHKSVTRSKLLTTIANMLLMHIGIEACGGAHYWARTLNKLGHDARIMTVKYVIPDHQGKWAIQGGRTQVRKVLFMTMMSTMQCNPVYKATYQRILDAGKPKKVAILLHVCVRWL